MNTDWANCLEDRKSYRGFAFIMAGSPVASRKQKTTALSSTEAEYMVMSKASKEGVYLQGLFTELGERHRKGEIIQRQLRSHQVS